MSDNTGHSQLTCGFFSGSARSNAKLHICDKCGKSFHSACMKLVTVSINNKPGKACSTCIVQAMPSLNKSRSRTTSTSSTSDVAEQAGSSEPPDDAFRCILRVISSFRTAVETRLDKIDARLTDLEGLGVKVAANEVGLEEVKHELAEIRQRLDQDLVIGGLSVPTECNHKILTTAVLATVHPDIETWDVMAVRPSISNAVRDGDTSQTPGSTRPPALLVTLTSRALLEAVIRGKIKMGKLHTSALVATLPVEIKLDSITPALINVDEFLPFVQRKKSDAATLITSEEDFNRFSVS